MKKGYRDKIMDVKGVHVGYKTIAADNVQAGVTIILPTEGDIFREKLTAPCHVINDFGKTGGLIQLEGLGILENPITLTSVLRMGTVRQTLVRYMLQDHPEIGTANGTVNVVAGGCNDGYLNDIRACSIQESSVCEAIVDAGKDFALGTVGADRGMSCFRMKGGIDSASRMLELNGEEYAMGPLALSNLRLKDDYTKGNVSFHDPVKEQVEQGSIITALATDIPMFNRQLKRVRKRMPVVLARLGSHPGNGSGDIAVAFLTANKIPHSAGCLFILQTILHEQRINKVFRAGIEACEEVIQNPLDAVETVAGREGHCGYSLKDTVTKIRKGQDCQ